MICRFADFNFEIKNRFPYTEKYSTDYITDSTDIDYSFSVSDEEMEYERRNDPEHKFSDGYIEFIAILRKLAEWLPFNDAFFLHSAVFEVAGHGVAFAAVSGTGKTTHMRLWQELLGDKLKIINGDKPFVRFFGEDGKEVPYAYGVPWNGKERYGTNARTPLKHICIIERAEKNSCVEIPPNEAINKFFLQVYLSRNAEAASKTLELVNRLTKACVFWKISCNTDISAARTAYNAIFGANGAE